MKSSSEQLPAVSPPTNHIRLVFISLLLDLVAFTLLLPLLPTILAEFSHYDSSGLYATIAAQSDAIRRTVGAPSGASEVLIGGALGSMFSLLQFVVAPISGALSDVYGRRPLMLLSLVGISCSYVLWTFAASVGSFAAFVGARVLCGLSKGNVNLCTAIVSDVTDSRGRARGIAWIGVAFSLGFIVGPTIGGVLASSRRVRHTPVEISHGFEPATTPALTALILSLVNLVFVYGWMTESLPDSARRVERSSSSESKSNTALLNYISPVALLQFRAVKCSQQYHSASLRCIGSVYFLYLLIFSGVEFTLPFLCHARFQFGAGQQGCMFLYMGVVMALVQGGIARRLPPHLVHRAALWSLSLLVPTFLVLAWVQTVFWLCVALGLYAVSTALCVPCMTTVATRYGGVHQRGVVTGVFRSLGALARAAGPLPASAVFWLYGAGVCYSVSAVAMLAPVVLLARGQTLLSRDVSAEASDDAKTK